MSPTADAARIDAARTDAGRSRPRAGAGDRPNGARFDAALDRVAARGGDEGRAREDRTQATGTVSQIEAAPAGLGTALSTGANGTGDAAAILAATGAGATARATDEGAKGRPASTPSAAASGGGRTTRTLAETLRRLDDTAEAGARPDAPAAAGSATCVAPRSASGAPDGVDIAGGAFAALDPEARTAAGLTLDRVAAPAFAGPDAAAVGVAPLAATRHLPPAGLDAAAARIGAAAAASAPLLANAPANPAPVGSLRLALTPTGLGEIEVTLRLRGGRLEASLAADRPETAALVEARRGEIADALRAAGYEVDAGAVATRARPPEATQHSAAADGRRDGEAPGSGQRGEGERRGRDEGFGQDAGRRGGRDGGHDGGRDGGRWSGQGFGQAFGRDGGGTARPGGDAPPRPSTGGGFAA